MTSSSIADVLHPYPWADIPHGVGVQAYQEPTTRQVFVIDHTDTNNDEVRCVITTRVADHVSPPWVATVGLLVWSDDLMTAEEVFLVDTRVFRHRDVTVHGRVVGVFTPE